MEGSPLVGTDELNDASTQNTFIHKLAPKNDKELNNVTTLNVRYVKW